MLANIQAIPARRFAAEREGHHVRPTRWGLEFRGIGSIVQSGRYQAVGALSTEAFELDLGSTPITTTTGDQSFEESWRVYSKCVFTELARDLFTRPFDDSGAAGAARLEDLGWLIELMCGDRPDFSSFVTGDCHFSTTRYISDPVALQMCGGYDDCGCCSCLHRRHGSDAD